MILGDVYETISPWSCQSVTEWEVQASKSEELISIPVNKSNWIQDEVYGNNVLDGEGNVLLLWQAAQIDLRKWNTYSIWQRIKERRVRKTEIIMMMITFCFLENLTKEKYRSASAKLSQTANSAVSKRLQIGSQKCVLETAVKNTKLLIEPKSACRIKKSRKE